MLPSVLQLGSIRKKKIFDKSEGEYVEFEEVASSSGTEHRTNVKYETEEQISDAE